MSLQIKVTGDFKKFNNAIKVLGESKAKAAYRMALNDTNKAVFTQVKRTLAKQMGVTQGAVIKHGGLIKLPATNGGLSAELKAVGGYLPLKDFKARQGKKGVSASPWGKRQIFGSTFVVGRLGGNVFKRTGVFSDKTGLEKIEKLWGPAVPNELVKGLSAEAFNRIAKTKLPAEVARQLKRLSGGVIS